MLMREHLGSTRFVARSERSDGTFESTSQESSTTSDPVSRASKMYCPFGDTQRFETPLFLRELFRVDSYLKPLALAAESAVLPINVTGSDFTPLKLGIANTLLL